MDLGTSRLYRAPGEPGHQHQAQRWFNTSDITAAHQNSLLKQLNQQRHQERFCDCSVLVEGQLFRAHRNVLFASSGYFRMLLSHQQGAGGGGGEGLADDVITATATFDAFSPETFAVILDFIYSGQLELSGHNVIEVMSAASYLQMNNVISYCKSFIKSSLDISIKEEEEERCLGLPEVCGFTTPPGGGAGDDASSDHQQQQQRAPCSSVSPPPALWTHDNSRSQPAFLVKDPDGEAPSLEMKVESTSPAQHDLGRDEDDDLHDPHDPLFTLPGSERRRGRGGAAKRRAPPYSSRSSSAARREALELQEARAQKAEKAEELYATLPTILGFIGNFNKDTNPSMRFKCPFCTHTVKRKADLKRHLRCHTGERPYPCQACNKRFTRLEHLRSHVETIHQARKLVCRKCKCPVTEETGHVVCEGTRRYRMCTACVQEVGCGGGDDNVPGMMDGLEGESGEEPALLLGVDGEEEGGGGGDTQGSWVGDDDGDDDLAEDSGADLIIQEVDDSDVELQ